MPAGTTILCRICHRACWPRFRRLFSAVRNRGTVFLPIILRRLTTCFFGKILKVDLTVTNSQPPKLPRLRRRLWAVAALVLWALVLGSCVGNKLSTARAEEVPAQTGLNGSVYQRSPPLPATALGPAAVTSPAAAVDSPTSLSLSPADAAEQGGRAERIVAAALAGLARSETISARVRQLARVGNTVLKGSGRYVQSGLGEEQRFRFESRLNSESEEFELLELCDGLFFWTYRKFGSHPAQVERVDMRRVRERLEKLKVAERDAVSAYLGGVQRSLALVREWFRFVSVVSAAIDDVPAWTIEGAWNRDRLATILPAQAEAIRSDAGITAAQLPEGIPWSVRLSIDKRALFPCRIEWLAIPGPRPVAASALEVVAILELYDVRIGDPVDATAFVYKPATEGLMDTSDAFVNGLPPLRP